MKPISIRYGETLNVPITVDDDSAVSATFYVGKPGETPSITASTALVERSGEFDITDTDTRIPLGEYYYQITVTTSDGKVDKYPKPEDCEEHGLPKFTVHEALDEQEVS